MLIENKNIEKAVKDRVKLKILYVLGIFLIVFLIIFLFLDFHLRNKEKELEPVLPKIDFDNPAMLSPEYKGFSDDGKEFIIKSIKAVELEDGTILLNSPVANLLQSENLPSFILDSTEGEYDKKEKTLKLIGEVDLDDSKGNKFKASEIQVDLKKNIIYSDNNVDLSSEMGKISSQGLEIKDKGQVIIFKGKSKMIINPDKNISFDYKNDEKNKEE